MKLRCSNCGTAIDVEVGVCVHCGLVLGGGRGAVEPEAEEPEPQFDVDLESFIDPVEYDQQIEALSAQQDPFTAVHTETTVRRDLEHAFSITGVTSSEVTIGQVYPVYVEGVELGGRNCTPFEVFLLSHVDGQHTISDIVDVSGLTLFETVMALASLCDKGILRFEPTAVRQRPTAEPTHVTLRELPVRQDRRDGGARLGRVTLKARPGTAAPHVVAEDPDILLDRAEHAYRVGDLSAAREAARLAVLQAPNSERGRSLLRTLQDSESAASRAKVLLDLGLSYFRQRDYLNAIPLLEGALQEYEALAVAHHCLAVALARTGADIELAIYHSQRSVELAPDYEASRRNLEKLLDFRSERREGSLGLVDLPQRTS